MDINKNIRMLPTGAAAFTDMLLNVDVEYIFKMSQEFHVALLNVSELHK